MKDQLIFSTERSRDGYNCRIRFNEEGKLLIAIYAGATGVAIMLTDDEAEAFVTAVAAQLPAIADGIRPHEPSTCGNAYLASERALRIIENATKLGESMSADAIKAITDLAHEAGAACNRLALKRDTFADELPF